MWIFTIHGFFSVVAYAVEGGNNMPNPSRTRIVDPSRVAVRARNPAHLESLQRAYPELNGKIRKTKRSDYCCRLIVTKEIWTSVAAKLAAGINYDNFKAHCHEQAELDKQYIAALYEVWATMCQHQRQQPQIRLTNR